VLDDELRLVVLCCHPAIDHEAQVALTLRLGCGVATAAIAAAFLVPTPTMAARLTRAKQRIAAAGASDRVHLVGAHESIPDIMKASYVLAAPILQEETFGNVALEARSVGLPVVTFARGGLTELVSHGTTGYVCASADLAGLLDGLRYFLAHPAERATASAGSLAVSVEPGNDCTPGEFERRWWAMFEKAS